MDVAASSILADLDRKKKGSFPSYSLQVPMESNLARLRLVVHEKTGKRLFCQSLHLIDENNTCRLTHLPDTASLKNLADFISDQTEAVSHIIMIYNDEDSGSAETRKRRNPKYDAEMENGIKSALFNLAFRGMKPDEYDAGKGKKAKMPRPETGFRDTFLTSSTPEDTYTGTEDAQQTMINNNKVQ